MPTNEHRLKRLKVRRFSRLFLPTSVVVAILVLVSAAQQDSEAGGTAVSPATLKSLLEAFNAHDLDRIMEFFADDCELCMPRGKEPWGQRFAGKAAVRRGLASRFEGIPDVHYGDDHHWVAGNLGVSTWLLTGTTKAGEELRVRGVDLLEFRNGKIVKKDSYWKILEK